MPKQRFFVDEEGQQHEVTQPDNIRDEDLMRAAEAHGWKLNEAGPGEMGLGRALIGQGQRAGDEIPTFPLPTPEHIKAAQSVGSAVTSGLRQPLEGLEQTWDRFAEDVLEISDPGTFVDTARRHSKMREADYARAKRANPDLDRETFDLIKDTAALGTETLATSWTGPARYFRLMAYDFLIGAGGEALRPHSEDQSFGEFLGEMTVGGLLNATIGFVPNTIVGAKNAMGRAFRSKFFGPDQSNREVIEEAEELQQWFRDFTGDTTFTLTPGQITGHPDILKFENMAKVGKQMEVANKETAAFREFGEKAIDEILDTAGVGEVSPRTLIVKAEQLIGRRLDSMQELAHKKWIEGVEGGIAIAGNRTLGKVTHFERAVADWLGDPRDPAKVRRQAGRGARQEAQPIAFLERIMKDNKRVNLSGLPGITAREMDDYLKGINDLWTGRTTWGIVDPEQRKRVANELREALNRDIGDWTTRWGGGKAPLTPPWLVQMQAGRANYATIQGERRALSEHVVTKLISGHKDRLNAGEIVDELAEADQSVQRTVRNFLLANNPPLLAQLQSSMIRRAMDKSMNPQIPANFNDFEIGSFINALVPAISTRRGTRRIGNGLFSHEQVQHINKVMKIFRKIQQRTLRSSPEAMTRVQREEIRLDDISINVVSRSPEFMARAITRALTPGGVEKLLFTEEGLQILTTIHKSPWGSKAMQRAVAGLLMLTGTEDDFPESAPSPEGIGGSETQGVQR